MTDTPRFIVRKVTDGHAVTRVADTYPQAEAIARAATKRGGVAHIYHRYIAIREPEDADG